MQASSLILCAMVVGGIAGIAIYALNQMRKTTEASTNAVLDAAEKVFMRAGGNPAMYNKNFLNTPCVVERIDDADDEEKIRELEKKLNLADVGVAE